jgi:hypothetical protein
VNGVFTPLQPKPNNNTNTMLNTGHTNETHTLNISIKPQQLARIVAAFERDSSKGDQQFNDWALAIILDWVEEVEKPAPQRGLGFGS